MKKIHPLIFLLSFIYFIFTTTATESQPKLNNQTADISQTNFTNEELLSQQNHITSHYYPAKKISNLIIKTTYETLEFSEIYGSEISVDIYSNNNTILPKITLENTTLTITSSVITDTKKATKGDKCKIIIYLPKEMWLNNLEILYAPELTTQALQQTSTQIKQTQKTESFKIPQVKTRNTIIETINTDIIGKNLTGSIIIKTKTGNITLENISPLKISKEKEINQQAIQVYAITNEGTINLNNFTGNYISLKAQNSIKANNISCNFFEIKTTEGSISLILKNAPIATSKISTTSGLIKLFIPKNASLTLNTKSARGLITDKINNTRKNRPNNILKNYNNGGSIINLETTTGNIEIEDF